VSTKEPLESAARKEEASVRAHLGKAKKLIVKIGSKSLTGDAFQRFAEEVAGLRGAGRQVVIVSSGAIALGIQRLGLRARPKDMAWLQACAAAGQSTLMRKWEDALAPLGLGRSPSSTRTTRSRSRRSSSATTISSRAWSPPSWAPSSSSC